MEKASSGAAQLPELGENAMGLLQELQEATPLLRGIELGEENRREENEKRYKLYKIERENERKEEIKKKNRREKTEEKFEKDNEKRREKEEKDNENVNTMRRENLTNEKKQKKLRN